MQKPASTYRLKIALRGIEPPIWRSVVVLGDTGLSEFHAILQTALGWKDAHPHNFTIGKNTYGVPVPGARHLLDEKRFTLQALLTEKEKAFSYTYDPGDDWRYEILVEAIGTQGPKDQVPSCLGGARACPPEDCGGVSGYQALVAALADPNHPDHGSMKKKAGDFKAEAFDLKRVNELLKPFAVAPKLAVAAPAIQGRNELCACGSKKKFKHCHGAAKK